MPNTSKPNELPAKNGPVRQQRRSLSAQERLAAGGALGVDVHVGRHLRKLRASRGLSIRSLADLSGLNVNTLSLIENGRSSPSVSTLQQLATALDVPITSFFETEMPKISISYQKAGQRSRTAFAHGTLEDLGGGLTLRGGLPFLVTLEPDSDSGLTPIVHTGYEFVYCLEGCLSYTIHNQVYSLEPGDSLLFEAFLPHYWHNDGEVPSRSLLVLCPADEGERPSERHFTA